MKSFKFFLAIIVILPQLLFSQVVDTKAQKILDETYAKIQSYKTLKIDFTYVVENSTKNTRNETKGSITIKGNKYVLSLDDQIIFCDGTTKWTYFINDKEVQINSVNADEELLPNYILLADYKKDHYPKFIRELPKNNKVINVIDLVPKTGKSYYKIRLEIDNNTKLLTSASVYNKDNNTFIYVIDKLTPNIDVSDNYFVFNEREHPDVVVNDMR
jgi:outer membrane lipoprotein-sorting protein